MRKYIVFNNISSEFYNVHVGELPPVQKAQRRVEYIQVPGRDGYLTIDDECFEPIEKEVTLHLRDSDEIADINSWLDGEGDLILSNQPDTYYKARVDGPILYERVGRYRKAVIKFMCQPYGYLSDGLTPITLTAAGTLVNPGTAPSAPVITLNASGNVTLTINAKNVILTGIDGYVTINSEIEECYKDLVPKNATMSGEWPALAPGDNAISWTGTVTSVVITPNWRDR